MFLNLILLQAIIFYNVGTDAKKAKPINQTDPSVKFNNPNYIKDRTKGTPKPQMNDTWVKSEKKAFNVAWMDYCDPYHCNDYHKNVCGLNRNNMKFKWFQSTCHLIINNQCANYRGALKYDLVDQKFCTIYVMHLRTECPKSCEDAVSPVCGLSTVKNQAVLFRNKCALNMANCRTLVEGYEQVSMAVCDYYLRHA